VLLRYFGGQPVYRHLKQNVVGQAVTIFNSHDEFSLALAPEGTRKLVHNWKSGFYHIALAAKVPIQCMAFDYKTKQLIFSEPFYPTGDLAQDTETLRAFFNKSTPKYPKLADTQFVIESPKPIQTA
jgi:1-acyl-sn-glycerol-3-phosphate acyltransferase